MYNMSSFESNNVLTIKTVQIAPFRTLMTALKDILLETNITFKKDGIRIINMDKSHTMLAHLFLGAENFEHYECNKEKIVVGVNMFHLFKLINSIDNDDTEQIYDDGLDQLTDLSLATQNRIRSMKARHDEVLRLLHDRRRSGLPTNMRLGYRQLRD